MAGARRVTRAGVHPTGAPRAQTGASQSQVVEIQRRRLLSAAVRAVDELGYTHATVAHITRRARVSRRTFYELFADREACLLAVFADTLATLGEQIEAAVGEQQAWRERVRTSLSVILSFFDREPVLARVCVVQALQGGTAVLELRQRVLARLTAVIDEGRAETTRSGECTSLTAEGLVGAAFTVIHTRLLSGQREPLIDLAGELMGLLVLPYLGSASARREQTRPTLTESIADAQGVRATRATSDPLAGLEMRMTYRTARVLACVADDPRASNRLVAERAGISDQGQVSKLLARLERLGLLENLVQGHVKGEPNAWQLTEKGEEVVRSIRTSSRDQQRRAA